MFLGFFDKHLKFKTAIFGLFWSKMKKTRMDSDRKWKVCLIKVPLFFLKNAWGASYKHFYIFFVIPLRGHFRHTTPAPILISFFLFFHMKPTADLSERCRKDQRLFEFSLRLSINALLYFKPVFIFNGMLIFF